MEIKINDNIVLTTDQYNIVVNEIKIVSSENKKGKKSKNIGKVYYRPIAFYSKLEQVISGLINNTVFNSTATNFEDLLTEIKTMKREAVEAVEKYDWLKLRNEIDKLEKENKKLKEKLK